MKNKQMEDKMEKEAELIDKAVSREKLKKTVNRKLPLASKERFEIEL